jgi:DivIVA domain-containing protein
MASELQEVAWVQAYSGGPSGPIPVEMVRMAIPFPSPDPTPEELNPADVAAQQFEVVRHGYDRDAVRRFLSALAERLSQLESDARRPGEGSVIPMETLRPPGFTDDDDIASFGAPAQITRGLTDALRSLDRAAERSRAQARSEANQLVADAAAEAELLREETAGEVASVLEVARAEAERILDEAREEAEGILDEAAFRMFEWDTTSEPADEPRIETPEAEGPAPAPADEGSDDVQDERPPDEEPMPRPAPTSDIEDLGSVQLQLEWVASSIWDSDRSGPTDPSTPDDRAPAAWAANLPDAFAFRPPERGDDEVEVSLGELFGDLDTIAQDPFDEGPGSA